MFTYWWYRHIHFRPEFEKDTGVGAFAEYYMASNLDKIKQKGDAIRKSLRALMSDRARWLEIRDRLAAEGEMASDADLPEVAAKYRRLLTLLIFVFVGETGLNMFTAMIAIPTAGIFAGIMGDFVRFAIAVVVTAAGIVAAEMLFHEILPSNAYARSVTKRPSRSRSWPRAAVWALVLFGVEYMIYHFGLARVSDVGGGHVNIDIAKSLIVLSMIVPIVGGGIAWELMGIHSPYKNRVKHDASVRRIDRASTLIEGLREKENGFFQQKTNDYWYTYTRVRSFKEYFNAKKQLKTLPLTSDTHYAATYESFYSEALKRYSSHKEKQDPLAVKLDSTNAGVLGRKVGQDYAPPL